MTASGKLIGPIVQPMSIAALAYSIGPLWRDAENLVMAVAVALAESDGYSGSYNDNYAADETTVVSRDCGLWEINVPASKIGSDEEIRLREDVEYNAQRAYALFEARGWQPWSAYNSAIALDDTYQARALLGTVNFLGKRQVELQHQHADRSSHHTIRVPFVSRKQLRAIYPNIPLG